jgi:hypothetical protein
MRPGDIADQLAALSEETPGTIQFTLSGDDDLLAIAEEQMPVWAASLDIVLTRDAHGWEAAGKALDLQVFCRMIDDLQVVRDPSPATRLWEPFWIWGVIAYNAYSVATPPFDAWSVVSLVGMILLMGLAICIASRDSQRPERI